MTSRRVLPLVVCGVLVSARPGHTQLPLDPLDAREVQTAQRVASENPRVRELIGQRRSVLGATYFLALKPETGDLRAERAREPEPMRAAIVVYYVYDGDYGVQVLVDLRRAVVLRVERLQDQPIPFAAEEIETARALALREPRLRQAVGPAAAESRIEWLGFTAVDERDPCYKHRCVQLLFRRGRAFLMRPIVIVDLTTQQVRLEEPPR